MDPVSLIVSALVAGLSSALTDSAKDAIRELRNTLRSKIAKTVEKKNALEKLEIHPDSKPDQELLKVELSKTSIDEELIELARQILAKIDLKGTQSGKYNISIENSQGITLAGDNTTISMRFENNGRKKKAKK